MRLICSLLAVTLALSSCGPPAFRLLAGTDWPNPPTDSMSVFIGQESDLEDKYSDRVGAFGIVSVRERLVETLSGQKVPYLSVTLDDSEPTRGKTSNFLSVTADSAQADLVISVVVVDFGYDRLSEAQRILGVPSVDGDTEEPKADTLHGYILLSGYVTERESQRVLHSFDGTGLTEADLPRREALQEAIDEGVDSFVAQMLQATF